MSAEASVSQGKINSHQAMKLLVSINRGIIQGSGIGPTLHIGMKSDLKIICTDNVLIKYADDVDLLVPENSKVDITDEFEHIKKWANTNSMVINLAKTKEIVFHRPNPRNFVKPAAMDTIEQLTVAKILGVFVHGGFKCDNHVDFILSACSQRVYWYAL